MWSSPRRSVGLVEVTKWYSNLSPASPFALTMQRMHSEPGAIILGSEFDVAKLEYYKSEIDRRIGGAAQIPGIAKDATNLVLRAQGTKS